MLGNVLGTLHSSSLIILPILKVMDYYFHLREMKKVRIREVKKTPQWETSIISIIWFQGPHHVSHTRQLQRSHFSYYDHDLPDIACVLYTLLASPSRLHSLIQLFQ